MDHPELWRQEITCLVLTMSTGSVLVTPAHSDQLRGPPPLPGGNITPGNNTAIDNTLDIMAMLTEVILATPPSAADNPHPRLIALSITLDVPQIPKKKENRN